MHQVLLSRDKERFYGSKDCRHYSTHKSMSMARTKRRKNREELTDTHGNKQHLERGAREYTGGTIQV